MLLSSHGEVLSLLPHANSRSGVASHTLSSLIHIVKRTISVNVSRHLRGHILRGEKRKHCERRGDAMRAEERSGNTERRGDVMRAEDTHSQRRGEETL